MGDNFFPLLPLAPKCMKQQILCLPIPPGNVFTPRNHQWHTLLHWNFFSLWPGHWHTMGTPLSGSYSSQLQSPLCRVSGYLRPLQHKLRTGLAWAELNSVFTGFHSFPLSMKRSYNSPYVQDTLMIAKPKAQGHCQSSLAVWQLRPRNHVVVFKNSLLLQRPFLSGWFCSSSWATPHTCENLLPPQALSECKLHLR